MNCFLSVGKPILALAVAVSTAGLVRPCFAAHVPVFEAVFGEMNANVTIVNYQDRTPPAYRRDGDRTILEFTYRPRGEKADTMWGVKTLLFDVKAGRSYLVFIEMEGDLPVSGGSPGASISWIGPDGKPLDTQDALGNRSELRDLLNIPMRRKGVARPFAFSRGVVPAGAVRATIGHRVDNPDLKEGARVAFRRIAYFEHRAEEPFDLGDTDSPTLEMLTPSPCGDCRAPIRFRVTDPSGINWAETVVRIDRKVVPVESLRREGDVLVCSPETPWQADSIHVVEVDATDAKGNAGYDCGFVTFTTKKAAHPCCAIRDDGMLLVDGKPSFPLGWFRVRQCEGNGFSLEKGLADMEANGMNFAHTYMSRGRVSARETELFDELVAACERHHVMLYAEPGDRKPQGPNYVRYASDNLLRGLGWTTPVFWGIGDDTSMHFTPDDLKFCHRLCKSADPGAMTISADIATGPGGHVPYAPSCDMLFLESYPILAEKPEDHEMAKAAENLDNAWTAIAASKVPNRSVVVIPQVFKGWRSWKRMPTEEEVRCQAYLAIAGRSRGLVWYASCGNRFNVPPAEPETLKNWGPLNLPECREWFFALTREIAALTPSLVLRDAQQQPVVTPVGGTGLNCRGGRAIRCLLKEDGLLVAANTSHLPVTVDFTLPDGTSFRHAFSRNGVLVRKTGCDGLKKFPQ